MSYIQVIYFFRSEINRMSSEVFVQKQVKQIQFKLSDFEFGSWNLIIYLFQNPELW